MPRGPPASPGAPLSPAARMSKCFPVEDTRTVRVPSTRTLLTLTLLLVFAAAGRVGPVSAGAVDRLRLVNLDLTGAQGPLNPARYAQLRSLLLYMDADILVLHAATGATGGRAGHVQQLARSLGMYCAYLPAAQEAQTGTAVMSRHRFEESTTVSLGQAPGGLVTAGGIDVRVGARPLTLLVMNAAATGESGAAVEAVAGAVERIAELLEARPDGHFVALASLGSEALAQTALEGLTQAGLADALSASGRQAFTFPAIQPDQRLDFILASANLERAATRSRVLTPQGMARLSQHHPVELTLSY